MHGVNFFSESCANQASFENNLFYGAVRVDGIDYHVGETVEVSSSPMLGTASQVARIESLWWEVVNRWCTVTSCDSTVDTSKPAIDMSCRLFFSACGPREELHATNQLAENLPKRDEVYEPLKKGQWPRFIIITCMDTRVAPEVLLGIQPGEAISHSQCLQTWCPLQHRKGREPHPAWVLGWNTASRLVILQLNLVGLLFQPRGGLIWPKGTRVAGLAKRHVGLIC